MGALAILDRIALPASAAIGGKAEADGVNGCTQTVYIPGMYIGVKFYPGVFCLVPDRKVLTKVLAHAGSALDGLRHPLTAFGVIELEDLIGDTAHLPGHFIVCAIVQGAPQPALPILGVFRTVSVADVVVLEADTVGHEQDDLLTLRIVLPFSVVAPCPVWVETTTDISSATAI